MPQIMLPVFPKGVTYITPSLAFQKENGKVTYFNASMPVFSHDQDDHNSFRMITAQFCVLGNTKQAEIARAFGVTSISVKRAVKLYRTKGPEAFYTKKKGRGPAVLTTPVLKQAQELFDEGVDTASVARKIGVKTNTLSKAVKAGRVHKPEKKNCTNPPTKSQRTEEDSNALMGTGTTHLKERIAASVGELIFVEPQFKAGVDITNGGVLTALPALLSMGLLESTDEFFDLPKGYYGLDSLFLLLGMMALTRQKSIESLRYCAPGEWGKLLGLDRIPEVRTLRDKVKIISEGEGAEQWSATLCKNWMESTPGQAGVLYIDGHVRVYNGSLTKLPRHHVARQRLCLRATSDYWVNAMDGQPFFVVNKVVDPGLIQVLEEEIVPRLEQDVPGQPEQQDLEEDPLLHRFSLVFDREGYSPGFFKRMKNLRIACLTYHKYPSKDWPIEQFLSYEVVLVGGQKVTMSLSERGVQLSNNLWVREIRKLSNNGHQTSVLTTDYCSAKERIAIGMFARWCQENYFKYMREEFSLDRLAEYGVEDISDPIKIVNPKYRDLDGQVRSTNGKLARALARFGAMNFEQAIEPESMEPFITKKAELHEGIEILKKEISELKMKRKSTSHHIDISELPKEEQFKKLSTKSKRLIDTIKMVAYRAETSMSNILKEHLSQPDTSRSLLKSLYKSEADLIPNEMERTLTVRLHHMANHASDSAIKKMCSELNATETIFPRTDLRIIFELGSSQNHRDQVF